MKIFLGWIFFVVWASLISHTVGFKITNITFEGNRNEVYLATAIPEVVTVDNFTGTRTVIEKHVDIVSISSKFDDDGFVDPVSIDTKVPLPPLSGVSYVIVAGLITS